MFFHVSQAVSTRTGWEKIRDETAFGFPLTTLVNGDTSFFFFFLAYPFDFQSSGWLCTKYISGSERQVFAI